MSPEAPTRLLMHEHAFVEQLRDRFPGASERDLIEAWIRSLSKNDSSAFTLGRRSNGRSRHSI